MRQVTLRVAAGQQSFPCIAAPRFTTADGSDLLHLRSSARAAKFDASCVALCRPIREP
jgi:hypothetical protein